MEQNKSGVLNFTEGEKSSNLTTHGQRINSFFPKCLRFCRPDVNELNEHRVESSKLIITKLKIVNIPEDDAGGADMS